MICLCNLQFDKHGSNFEKTKLKLLEAANLVDKVTLVLRCHHMISTDKSKCVRLCVTVLVHFRSTTRP